MKESKIEVLLYDVLHEMEDDLATWPPRREGDIDSKQMAKMWRCPERTARDRARRLANGGDGKWQWIKVRGNGLRRLRGIMVLRKNVSAPLHKSKEKIK